MQEYKQTLKQLTEPGHFLGVDALGNLEICRYLSLYFFFKNKVA